jgi:hypothetical protein
MQVTHVAMIISALVSETKIIKFDISKTIFSDSTAEILIFVYKHSIKSSVALAVLGHLFSSDYKHFKLCEASH